MSTLRFKFLCISLHAVGHELLQTALIPQAFTWSYVHFPPPPHVGTARILTTAAHNDHVHSSNSGAHHSIHYGQLSPQFVLAWPAPNNTTWL